MGKIGEFRHDPCNWAISNQVTFVAAAAVVVAKVVAGIDLDIADIEADKIAAVVVARKQVASKWVESSTEAAAAASC